jgi:uncharacterized membrane protein
VATVLLAHYWRTVTQTSPSWKTMSRGSCPRSIVSVTVVVSGSIREIVPLIALATQMAPAPAAIAEGARSSGRSGGGVAPGRAARASGNLKSSSDWRSDLASPDSLARALL